MRALVCLGFLALAACAADRDVYGDAADPIAHCRDLPDPAERAACVTRARAGTSSAQRARDIGPPDCHPASTNPKDRDDC